MNFQIQLGKRRDKSRLSLLCPWSSFLPLLSSLDHIPKALQEMLTSIPSYFSPFLIAPNGLCSRQAGLVGVYLPSINIRTWSDKTAMLFIPRLAAAYCWGFVLFFCFSRAWPIRRVRLSPTWRHFLALQGKASWKPSARRACFGHASVGQSTKLTTFTQASFNKRLTALLLLSTEAQGRQTTCSSATSQHEPQRSLQPSGRGL